MIYLDNAATTFPKSEGVYKAMDEANRNLCFNTGRGSYAKAREATALVDDTKTRMLELVNAPEQAEVIFSSSITLALNQVINGVDFQEGDNIYVSPYEHNAVVRTVYKVCKETKANMVELPLTDSLEIDIEKMKYLFSKDHPRCVCCIHVSNVTGYILPYEDVFKEAKKYNAVTILDTAQSLGIVDINLRDSDVDFLAFAGHKSLYGPMGIGGFIDNSHIKLKTYFTGGTGSDSLNIGMANESPVRYEASSLNIVAVAGLNQTLKEININNNYEKEKQISQYLIEKLKTISGVTIYIPNSNEDKHIAVISFNLAGYLASDVGMMMDEDFDIALRTGYHCAPLIHNHLKDIEYGGTVRVGIGRFTSIEDIDKTIEALKNIISN